MDKAAPARQRAARRLPPGQHVHLHLSRQRAAEVGHPADAGCRAPGQARGRRPTSIDTDRSVAQALDHLFGTYALKTST